MNSSTPTFSEFDPTHIPYQETVLHDLYFDYDYSKGVHEVLLSGSLGCLREDALVQTISGKVPISDINSSMRLLTHHGSSNQFAFGLSSGAFPKGKDFLYRVITEHEEFVASGNHLIATSLDTYSKISDLFCDDFRGKVPYVQLNECHDARRLALREGVLHCWQTIVSLINHCLKHIHQYDQQLLFYLKNVLTFFPSQSDAQEFGLFFCSHKFAHWDDSLERAQEHVRTSESPFLQSTLGFFHLLEHGAVGVADDDIRVGSKFYEHILRDSLRSLLFGMQNVHQQDLRSFLYVFLASLTDILSVEVCISNSAIIAIERQTKEEWYWDIQVPNTHNYVANGFQHHNSAKSILMAHIAVRHCVENPGARLLLGRKAMPDLKDTIYRKILEHLEGTFVEGKHYWLNTVSAKIKFSNGSEIISRSWSDKKYMKMRSLELSAAIIEELTENNTEDKQAYDTIRQRVGRLPHVKMPFIISATNPDSPMHWAYDYFIKKQHKTRRVYYSVTTDNPFLPDWYIEQLKQDMDHKLARRLIYGEWLEISEESTYYSYNDQINFLKRPYEIRKDLPIILTWDFNIGLGKPMSMCCGQFDEIKDEFHFFKEVIIDGARMADTIDELSDSGMLTNSCRYIVCGDASGKNRDTRSSRSDYDIIRAELSKRGLQFEFCVPMANPSVRTRHNRVNSYCLNANDVSRLFVYQDCEGINQGMKFTKLKKGADYVEDDSYKFQHVTTAIGYAIMFLTDRKNRPQQRTVHL